MVQCCVDPEQPLGKGGFTVLFCARLNESSNSSRVWLNQPEHDVFLVCLTIQGHAVFFQAEHTISGGERLECEFTGPGVNCIV